MTATKKDEGTAMKTMKTTTKYATGDSVIYPQHGAGKVVDRRAHEWNGNEVDYLLVDFELQDLRVWIPAAEVEEIGVRKPVSKDEIDDVFAVLADHDVRISENFSRRTRKNEQRLNEGEVYDVAAVVRDLAVRKNEKHLSPTETRMFAHARSLLATELAMALGEDVEVMQDHIDHVLPG